MRASYHQNVHMKIHVRREECIFYLLSLGFAAELLLSFWQIAKFISGQMDNLMNWFILFGWSGGVTDRHDIWIRFVGVVTYNGKNNNNTLSWGLSVFVLPLYQSMAFFVLLIIKQIVTNYVSIFLHSQLSQWLFDLCWYVMWWVGGDIIILKCPVCTTIRIRMYRLGRNNAIESPPFIIPSTYIYLPNIWAALAT